MHETTEDTISAADINRVGATRLALFRGQGPTELASVPTSADDYPPAFYFSFETTTLLVIPDTLARLYADAVIRRPDIGEPYTRHLPQPWTMDFTRSDDAPLPVVPDVTGMIFGVAPAKVPHDVEVSPDHLYRHLVGSTYAISNTTHYVLTSPDGRFTIYGDPMTS